MSSTLLSTKKVKDSSYRLRPTEFVRFRTERYRLQVVCHSAVDLPYPRKITTRASGSG